MKKILAVILVLTLSFSMLLVTACKNDKAGTGTSDELPFSSEEQETSSTRKRHSGSNTGSPTETSTDPTTSDDPTTSNDPPTSSDPTESSTEYGSYDYSYSTSLITPTDFQSPAGIVDSLIFAFVDTDFPRPTLEAGFYDALISLEQQYNALSATEKANVPNYPILLEARNAYNDMAKQECVKLISELPDATIDNIITFGRQANAIQALIDNIGNGEASKISNKAEYDNKITKADTLLVDTFNQKVSALTTFEYSTAYKAKLDEADVIYGLMNASQQSKVASSKQTLDTKKTLYGDTFVAKTFEEKILGLPDIANLTDTNKADVLNLKTAYSELTQTQQGLISQEANTKFAELEKWFVGGRIAYIFHDVYASCNESSLVKKGMIKKGVYSDFVIDGSSLSYNGDCDVNCFFEGTNYYGMGVNKVKEATITVQPKSATVFVIACNLKSEKKTCTITVTKNGTEMPELTTPLKYSENGKNCEYRFSLPEAGTYVISLTNCNDSVRVVALAMY